jgi:hypothetical protein
VKNLLISSLDANAASSNFLFKDKGEIQDFLKTCNFKVFHSATLTPIGIEMNLDLQKKSGCICDEISIIWYSLEN